MTCCAENYDEDDLIACAEPLGDELIRALIRHSYAEVVAKLPKRVKAEHPEILEIR